MVWWKDDANWVKGCTRFVVDGRTPAVRPWKTWKHAVTIDMRQLGVKQGDAQERVRRQGAIGRTRAHPTVPGNPPYSPTL